MSLSEQEQQALREIEASLLADDPKFGSTVSGGANFGDYSGGRLTLRGIALIVVGLVMLIGGVALAQQNIWFVALSILGFLLMFGASIWMLRGESSNYSGPTLRARNSSSAYSASRAPSRGTGSSLGDRMEQNFRRRFEDGTS